MLQNYTTWKVLSRFFEEPTKEHYLKQISRDIGLAHTSVKKHLDFLLKASIIKENVQKRGKRKFPVYSAEINGKDYRHYKSLYNITSLHDSGLIDFINDRLAPRCMVVFGSYQRGEDTEDSDIDLYVECKKENLDIKKFEKRLNRRIQLHFNDDFRSYPKELKNNIINGIVLKGFLEGY